MSDRPGIYVHVPFCRRICPYCDFAVVGDSVERHRRFTDLLVAEIEELEWEGSQGFDTVYFGGGTPSLLAGEDLERILVALRTHLDCLDLRIHLEANPEDVTVESVDGWRQLGVAFLSLGVQALSDERLEFFGREHSHSRALVAIEVAAAGGFDTLSMDLIYGHDQQSMDAWVGELEQAAAQPIDHLSCYSLTVSPATPFGQRQAAGEALLPDETAQAQFFLETHGRLAALGFEAYEVSNFSRSSERQSQHNRKYWRGAPYLGLGPSAHSFDGSRRWWNLRHESVWAKAVAAGESPIDDVERLTPEQRRLETLMLGLRTSEGVDPRLVDPDRVRELQRQGLAVRRADRLVLSVNGWLVADRIAAEL